MSAMLNRLHIGNRSESFDRARINRFNISWRVAAAPAEAVPSTVNRFNIGDA